MLTFFPNGRHATLDGQSADESQTGALLSVLMHNPGAPFGNVQFDRFGISLFVNSGSNVHLMTLQCPLGVHPRAFGPQSLALEQGAIA